MGYSQQDFASKLRQGSPWQVFLVGDVATTMEEIRRIEKEHSGQDWLVALAETQCAGLGRKNDRVWASSAEGVWMTALVRPKVPAGEAGQLRLAAAVAVAQALCGLGFPVGVKWPNDVLVAEGELALRKVCGIRTESQIAGGVLTWLSFGIGINVNHLEFPGEIAPKAASLRQLADGREQSRTEVACAVLDALEAVRIEFEQSGFDGIRCRWNDLAVGLGRQAAVEGMDGKVVGAFCGIDERGLVLLDAPDAGGPAAVLGDSFSFVE